MSEEREMSADKRVVLLPTHGSHPFVVLGELLAPTGSWQRMRVIKSWGLKLLPQPDSEEVAAVLRWEECGDEYRGILRFGSPERGGGGPYMLRFDGAEEADRVFQTLAASWQLWLGGALERANLTEEQERLIYQPQRKRRIGREETR